MRRYCAWTISMFLVLGLMAACGGGDDGGSDAGQDGSTGQDAGITEQSLGSNCICEGDDCAQMEVPKPAGGTIIGCDEVPTDWPGAAVACMRSYDGPLATATYFAQGYCTLIATACEGAELICNSAIMGDYESMVACPAGSVMIVDVQNVEVMGQTATIHNKVCAAGCEGEADCRGGEEDPVLEETTQYSCIDKDGVKFCYDPRNLSEDYTAESF